MSYIPTEVGRAIATPSKLKAVNAYVTFMMTVGYGVVWVKDEVGVVFIEGLSSYIPGAIGNYI